MSRAAVADPPEGTRKMMRALGYVTAITLAAAGIVLGVIAVKALPETRVACHNSCRAPDLCFYPRRSCSFASSTCS
jgi:hypothetical protein